MNDPKLKLAMARLLPEKILESYPCDDRTMEECQTLDEVHYWWYESRKRIHETEWLYVMHLVEQTLEDKQFVVYEELVYDSVVQSMPLTNLELEGIMRSDIKTAKGYIRAISATFNQRATAMCKVKGIEE